MLFICNNRMANDLNSVDNLPPLENKPNSHIDEWVKAADFTVRDDFTQKKYQNINWLYSEYLDLKVKNLQTWQNGVEPQKVKYFINNKNKIKNISVVNYYGDNIIVDGNHRATAARILGWNTIRAEYINYEDSKIDNIE